MRKFVISYFEFGPVVRSGDVIQRSPIFSSGDHFVQWSRTYEITQISGNE